MAWDNPWDLSSLYGGDDGSFGGYSPQLSSSFAPPPMLSAFQAPPPLSPGFNSGPPPSSISGLLAQMSGMAPPQFTPFNELPDAQRSDARRMGLMTLASALGSAPAGQLGSALAQGGVQSEVLRRQAENDYYRTQRQQYDDQFQGLSGKVQIARAADEEQRRAAEQARTDKLMAQTATAPEGYPQQMWDAITDPQDRMKILTQDFMAKQKQAADQAEVTGSVPGLVQGLGATPEEAAIIARGGPAGAALAQRLAMEARPPAAPRNPVNWGHIQDAQGNVWAWNPESPGQLQPINLPGGGQLQVPTARGAGADWQIKQVQLPDGSMSAPFLFNPADPTTTIPLPPPKRPGAPAMPTAAPPAAPDETKPGILSGIWSSLTGGGGADRGAPPPPPRAVAPQAGPPPGAAAAQAIPGMGALGHAWDALATGASDISSVFKGGSPTPATSTNGGGMPKTLLSFVDTHPAVKAQAAQMRSEINPITKKPFTWNEIEATVRQSYLNVFGAPR